MLSQNEFKAMLTSKGSGSEKAADVDKKIDENIQKRELMKLRNNFYSNLKEHYSSRKYKEVINLNCADRCLTNFRDDDLNRTEMNCLINCYNKYYRYLAFSNTLYTFLVHGEKVDEHLRGQ